MTTKRTPITCEDLAKMPAGTVVYDNSGASGIKLTFSHVDKTGIHFSHQEKNHYKITYDHYIGFPLDTSDFYLPNTDELA